jgi:hypothetical protein
MEFDVKIECKPGLSHSEPKEAYDTASSHFDATIVYCPCYGAQQYTFLQNIGNIFYMSKTCLYGAMHPLSNCVCVYRYQPDGCFYPKSVFLQS